MIKMIIVDTVFRQITKATEQKNEAAYEKNVIFILLCDHVVGLSEYIMESANMIYYINLPHIT